MARVEGAVIEAHDLTKSYGSRLAVNHLSFTVQPGTVTGFLGPNGAGKSTTMRLILGLDRPSSGVATIGGKPYVKHREPLKLVGALLEARAVHTGRTAYNHLLVLAKSQGIPRSRVDEVVDLIGLRSVARKRAGGFSLGMGQRLGLAVALLGDPGVLMLDEPVNGLDPEGILWIRNFLREKASEGRTVLVSSHLMSEMAVTADHLVVIGRGTLIANCSTKEFIDTHSEKAVVVRTPQAPALQAAVAGAGGRSVDRNDGTFLVHDLPAQRVGELAAQCGVVLHELAPLSASLEEAFMEMTRESLEFNSVELPADPAVADAGITATTSETQL